MAKKVKIEVSEKDAIRLYGLLDGCSGSYPETQALRVYKRLMRKVIASLGYQPGILGDMTQDFNVKDFKR